MNSNLRFLSHKGNSGLMTYCSSEAVFVKDESLLSTRRVGLNIMRKMIVFSLTAVVFSTVAWVIYLDSYFYAYSPRSPDPLRGFIYSTTVRHGTTVYLNAGQWRWFSSTAFILYFGTAIVVATSAYLLYRRWTR
jgi:hypothetical protein